MMLAAVTTISFAQKKTAMSAPEKIVKDLYAAQKNEKTNPFNQKKSRAMIDKYFAEDLAELLWKDATTNDYFDFDALYYSQDPQITKFVIGKPKPAVSPDFSTIPVTFLDGGTKVTIDFETMRIKGSVWKVNNIYYSDGEDLQSMLRYGLDAEFKKEYDDQPYKGDYMVGKVKCSLTPTLSGFKTRVECDGQNGFRFYEFEGTDTENTFVELDGKGKEKSRFVFKNGEQDGKFFDASGKEVKVTRVQ